MCKAARGKRCTESILRGTGKCKHRNMVALGLCVQGDEWVGSGAEVDAIKAPADSSDSQRPREQAGRRSALAFLQEGLEAFRRKNRDSLNLMAAVQFPPRKPAGLPSYNRLLEQSKFTASQERCSMCRGSFAPAGSVTAKLLTRGVGGLQLEAVTVDRTECGCRTAAIGDWRSTGVFHFGNSWVIEPCPRQQLAQYAEERLPSILGADRFSHGVPVLGVGRLSRYSNLRRLHESRNRFRHEHPPVCVAARAGHRHRPRLILFKLTLVSPIFFGGLTVAFVMVDGANTGNSPTWIGPRSRISEVLHESAWGKTAAEDVHKTGNGQALVKHSKDN